MVRGVLKLSLGSATAQSIAAVSQFALAFWLAPEQFGYWAAANSAVSLVSGFTNLGEVNAYLSGKRNSFTRVRRVTRRANVVLTVAGFGIAGYFAMGDVPELTILALIASLTIPVQGEADVLYAANIKASHLRRVVRSQMSAAIAKLIAGVGIAALTHSAVAIAVSTLLFFGVMAVLLGRHISLPTVHDGGEWLASDEVTLKERLSWAANTAMMTAPSQVGFLIIHFVASSNLLGIYFLSYQVTTGLSGFIVMPLARSALSVMARTQGLARANLAFRLQGYFGSGVALVVIGIVLAGQLVTNMVPARWALAIPVIAILAASMPVRMMTPVVDAYQQADNRWWQATAFQAVDAVGTASVALIAISGDVLLLATGLSVWKIAFGASRMLIVFHRYPSVNRTIGALAPVSFGGLMIGALLTSGISAWVCGLAAVAICFGWGAYSMRTDNDDSLKDTA